MTQQGRSDPLCFFCKFQQDHSPEKQPVSLNCESSSINNKISLKKQKNRPIEMKNRLPNPPSVMSFTNYTSTPAHFLNNRPLHVSLQSVTPKPTIRFSWNADLEHAKKNKQRVDETTLEAKNAQKPLDKTSSMRKLKHYSSLTNLSKTSLISITDNSPSAPKVEESVIMINYFHPNSQQLLNLEEHLKAKQQQ